MQHNLDKRASSACSGPRLDSTVRLRIIALATLILALAASTVSAGQPGRQQKLEGPFPSGHKEWRIPASPTGQRLGSLLSVLRSKDAGAAREYVEQVLDQGFREEHGVEGMVDFLMQTATKLDGFTLDGLERQPNGGANAILATPDGLATVLEIGVSEASPHLVEGLMFRPYDRQIEGVPEINTVAEANSYLEELAAAGKYGGVLAVMKDNEIIFTGGYGLAVRAGEGDEELRADPTFLYNVGSITKDFTRTAVLQLVATGKLKLSDTVGQHLERFPEAIADHVTVEQLLAFTSGLGNYHEHPDFAESVKEPTRLERVMDMVRDSELAFEPGTGNLYSNSGFAVLGAMVQSASGMDYYDYMQQNIFDRARMHNSRFLEQADPRAAVGYTRTDDGALTSNRSLIPIKGTPAGSSYSTAGDLLKFQQAMRDDVFGIGKDKVRYGCFAGGGPGVSAVRCASKDGLVIAVLSNVDEGLAGKVAMELFKALQPE